MAGRSYIRCHYSLIFVPQMVLRADITSRSHLILADYPGAIYESRTRDYSMASYRFTAKLILHKGSFGDVHTGLPTALQQHVVISGEPALV